MFDARTLLTLAVSFLTDFSATFMTGLTGGGLATGTTIPSKYVVLSSAGGGLVLALRGLQKNLSAPVPPMPDPVTKPTT